MDQVKCNPYLSIIVIHGPQFQTQPDPGQSQISTKNILDRWQDSGIHRLFLMGPVTYAQWHGTWGIAGAKSLQLFG